MILQQFELESIRSIINYPILRAGNTQITLGTVAQFVILLVLLFFLAKKVRDLLVKRVLPRSKLDIGAQQAVAAVTRYLVIFIGLLVILQTVGIDLTTLNVIAGAVGIGVGFGLQNIASNFISGLIILFERPIKIGDRIEIGDIEGDVIEIGARSTTVLTNDNITIIVPNSKFITENVVNWKHRDSKIRFKIPIGVAYGSDARLVEKILLKVAEENRDIMDVPPPVVRFLEFGESSLLFELRAWSSTLLHRKGVLISALNFAIYAKFKEHGIEIPFPQCDLHIRSGALELKEAIKPTKGGSADEAA
jgi:small-conductance mechanosensitive channel